MTRHHLRRNLDDARSRAINSVRSTSNDEVSRSRLDWRKKTASADGAEVLIAMVQRSDAVCLHPGGQPT